MFLSTIVSEYTEKLQLIYLRIFTISDHGKKKKINVLRQHLILEFLFDSDRVK